MHAYWGHIGSRNGVAISQQNRKSRKNRKNGNQKTDPIRQNVSLPLSALHNSFKNPQGGVSGGANSCPTLPPGHIGGRTLRKFWTVSNNGN